MTCIVGLLDKNSKRVFIGADSAGVAGYKVTIRKDEKIFKNGDFIIGCTSSFRMIQLLRFSFSPPEIGKKEIYQYMCTDFIEAIRNCFRNGGYMQKEKAGADQGGLFLVGYKDRLFMIGEDFQVGEAYEGLMAVGCGDEYALGSLFSSPVEMSPEEKINKALSAAAYFSAGVSAPFIVLGTE